MILLELPLATPSLNTTLRQHWLTAWKAKKRWRRLIRDALVLGGYYPLSVDPPPFATVRIERFGPRLLDNDNLVGGTKFLSDLLIEFRLIKDDSPEFADIRVVGLIHKIPGTRVRIVPRVP
jgi:hypothetical protein